MKKEEAEKLDAAQVQIVNTSRLLVKQFEKIEKMRAKFRAEKGKLNETLKTALETDMPADAALKTLRTWRGRVLNAWQEKIALEDFAKEQLAQAGADAKALRARLKNEIENADQLNLSFD